ncbi:glycosyltransferase [Candidatus Auribacterota bacterium]
MSKINVLLLTLNSRIGGTERMILGLAKGLDKDKYDPVICALVGNGDLISEAKNIGIEAVDLKMMGPLDFTVFFKIRRLIKQYKISILHTFLYHTNILGRIIGKTSGVPVVISTQRSTDEWRKFYHVFFDKITAGMADVIISNSVAGKNRLVETEQIPQDKIRVVYNGIEIDAEKCAKIGMEIRAALGIAPETKVIGTVANLKPAKCLRYLISCIPHVMKEFPDIKVVIVGYGPLRRNLERLAGALNVSDKVIFTGFQPDAVCYTASFDVFVLPSIWEGTPVSLMEAMALGKGIIASGVGGVPELIRSGKDGVLIPPENIGELSQMIIKLIAEPQFCRILGQSARQRMLSDFPLERMVKDTEAIYRELLEKKNVKI